MQKLLKCIQNNTTKNTKEIQKCISSMVCEINQPISLSAKNLLDAIELEGEFLVLKLHYNDFEDELKSQKIKYKISQALSVIVSYEEDGDSYNSIEKFIKYIQNNSDDKQNSTFGIKNGR